LFSRWCNGTKTKITANFTAKSSGKAGGENLLRFICFRIVGEALSPAVLAKPAVKNLWQK
jgi:hypothetical protein